MIIAKATGGRVHAHAETITNIQRGNIAFPSALVFSIPHAPSFRFFSFLQQNVIISLRFSCFSSCLPISSRSSPLLLFCGLLLQRSTASRAWLRRAAKKKLPPNSSNLFSFTPTYSPSLCHAVLSTASNSSIYHAGTWQEAATVLHWPNFDWPTSSTHSRVIYFFPFLAYTELHSSKGTYAAIEIILEVTQVLLLSVTQLRPTEWSRADRGQGEERTEEERRTLQYGPWTDFKYGKLNSRVENYKNIHTLKHILSIHIWVCVLCFLWKRHSAQLGSKVPVESHAASLAELVAFQ